MVILELRYSGTELSKYARPSSLYHALIMLMHGNPFYISLQVDNVMSQLLDCSFRISCSDNTVGCIRSSCFHCL